MAARSSGAVLLGWSAEVCKGLVPAAADTDSCQEMLRTPLIHSSQELAQSPLALLCITMSNSLPPAELSLLVNEDWAQAWVPGQLRAEGKDTLGARDFLGMLMPLVRSRLWEGGDHHKELWCGCAMHQSQSQKVLWAGMQFNAGCSPLSRTAGQSPPHSQGKINSLSEGRRNTPFKLQLILFLSGLWSSAGP